MIEELRPYESYRSSGDRWLGRLPSRWAARHLWTLSRLRAERNPGGLPLLSVFLDRGVIPYAEGGGQVHAPSLDLSNYQVVWPGDFVLNNQQAWRGSVGVSKYRGIISPAYIVLDLGGTLDAAYANYLFRCPRMVDQFVAASKGVGDIQRQVFWPFLRHVTVPLPSIDEQRAIVRFLDYTNRRLDRFARVKRKLIALLNEQKRTIIDRAVTQGINLAVPKKDAGLPWLASIPTNWAVQPMKQLLVRLDYGTSENAKGEGRVRVLTMAHIKDGRVLPPAKGALDAVPPGLLLETNDLLFNRTNSPDLVGKVGLFTGRPSDEITFASYLVRLRVRTEHRPQWLNYLLNSASFWAYTRSYALVSLHQANLNPTRYARMLVPVPPRAEQDQIVTRIVPRVEVIEAAVARAEHEISLIGEYRTRLVADVVTGQLDVREAAAHLPAEDLETDGTRDLQGDTATDSVHQIEEGDAP